MSLYLSKNQFSSVAQSCLTICDPMDYSTPGFPILHCLLESESRSVCVQLFATPWTIQSMEFSRQNTGVGSLSLLQGIFPAQGSNPGLSYCRRILYQLSHKGSPDLNEDEEKKIKTHISHFKAHVVDEKKIQLFFFLLFLPNFLNLTSP